MVKERRSRSKSPPRRTAEVTTQAGKKYEVTEKPRAKAKKQVEAAERRREKDAWSLKTGYFSLTLVL